MATEPQKTTEKTPTQNEQRSQSRDMTTDQRSQSREMTRDQRSQSRDMTTGRLGRMARPHLHAPFSPFSLMRRMFEDLERMTSFAMNPTDQSQSRVGVGGTGALAWIPDIDVTRRDDRLVVRADLPGLAPDEIRVSVEDDAIILEGERQSENVRDEGDVWQAERTYGRFRRVIPLPDGAKPETAEARFENGVLEIGVQVSDSHAGRRRNLEIKSGEQSQSASSQSSQKRGNGGT